MPVPGVIRRLAGVDYSAQRTFFVTLCVKDRMGVFRDRRLAELAQREILERRNDGWYWLLSYCIMPDHVHLLLRLKTPRRGLSRVVTALKNAIYYGAARIGLSVDWQLGYHDHVLRQFESVSTFARYILENPIRKSMVREYTDYQFCGVVDSWM